MNREGKKCVLYPRVSTEMQVDGYSLEGQKNSLKRFADREEMQVIGIYEDAGKSGKSIEGRPAFKKMLSDIKNGLEIDYILVYKLSRFGRNAADILNSLEFVQSYGINLICIEEGIDSSQTSGKLLISVLSAVAEIERENIIEQTMNGRREKARQGGWNGGFAPYGYYLKDNQLLIEEKEAEAIRIIFDKFGNSDIGLGGVAKYLNLQGIKKIPRQNGKLETWSSHLIRQILDNPVYCGKIAYGRRTREKVKGTKNEYKQVHADDYILEEGLHEGIVSEELWQKVHAKRLATGIKQPSKVGKDRAHLLTGVLKCPLCGSSMYTNKHAWTNKDGTYKEVYYYICGRNKQERGRHCEYKASLRKTDIEPLVIEAVKELVSDKYFAKEIEKRIGIQIDTTAIDKELENYESKLKEVDLNKARLEREIDNLPVDARYRERKLHDMTLRLDGLYDTIVELEERIEDAKLRRSSIEMEAITLDNIYKIMLNFGKLYDRISDEEKKSIITYLIKEIQIYPNGESEMPLRSIEFNFPIYRNGREIRRLLWEKGNTVDGHMLLWLRADWIRELGLEEPRTMDEAMQIIKAFVENDIAGDGRTVGLACSTGLIAGSSETYGVDGIFTKFGSAPEKWILDDEGNVVYGSVTSETKEALRYLNRLYQDGILDSRFLLRKTDNIDELLINGYCGAAFGRWWAPNNPLSLSYSEDKSAEWKPYLFAEDVQDEPQTFESYDEWMYVVVRKGYEHPEIVGKYVSAIFDYSRYEDDHYASEVNDYFSINVDPTARPMNINVDYIDALYRCGDNLQKALEGEISVTELSGLEKSYYNTCRSFLNGNLTTANGWAAYASRIQAVEVLDSIGTRKKPAISLGAADADIPQNLQDLESTAFLKIISGEEPVDYFDTFVQEWYAGGGGELTENVRDSYQ